MSRLISSARNGRYPAPLTRRIGCGSAGPSPRVLGRETIGGRRGAGTIARRHGSQAHFGSERMRRLPAGAVLSGHPRAEPTLLFVADYRYDSR